MSHYSPLLPLPSNHERNERPPFPAPAARGLDASDVAMRPGSIYGSRKASLVLDIIVVGCGIGGLSTAFCLTQAGHRVTIIESRPIPGEIGAGIHFGPNSTQLLYRWGLGKHLDGVAVRAEGIELKRYNTGERVGFMKREGALERGRGAPYCFVHRADLHKLLHDLVTPHVSIRLGAAVVGCDPDPVSPSVTLESGEVIQADLIVGADGVNSCIQPVVTGKPNSGVPTGDAAYRATIPVSLLTQDPELREFIEQPQMTVWTGPGRWVVGYPVRRKEVYNLALIHPDDESVESRTAEGNANKMRQDFVEFEPRVRKLLGFITSTLKWRLKDGKALDKWVHESGRVVLLGDACHPILPFRAQGAAMALEDCAVLANLLSRISHHSQLRPLLEAYQDLRLGRTETARESARSNRIVLTHPDGKEQRERDEILQKTIAPEPPVGLGALRREPEISQYQRDEKEKNDAWSGYDADAEVDKWWASHGRKLEQLEDDLGRDLIV